MNQDELKAAIIEAGEDKKGVACRKEPCEAVEVAFRKVGEGLWFSGAIIGADRVDGVSPFNFGSDATVGLGTVVQIAGELSGGVVALLERDNRYGAAALLRQLVGAEYLTWAFVEDEDEAMRWMRSSREERMRMWQPRHIRSRAGDRFRGIDHALHCGGAVTQRRRERICCLLTGA